MSLSFFKMKIPKVCYKGSCVENPCGTNPCKNGGICQIIGNYIQPPKYNCDCSDTIYTGFRSYHKISI